MIDINYWAVLVSAVAAFIFGGIWWSLIFGKTWPKLAELSPEQTDALTRNTGRKLALDFVSHLIMAYVLAPIILFMVLLTTLNATGADISTPTVPVIIGLVTSFFIWLGFIASSSLGMVIWEGKSWKLWFIKNGYYLIVLLIMGAILSVWR